MANIAPQTASERKRIATMNLNNLLVQNCAIPALAGMAG